MNWSAWKSPERDPLKVIAVIAFVVLCGIFIITRPSFRSSFLTGLVNPNDTAEISITLSSIPDATQVAPGIYGVGAAKMYDEMASEDGWLDTAKDLMEDLAPNNIRYPAGGIVKYIHAFTAHMSQPLTPAETESLVDVGDGLELPGIGYITQDRLDEEARGNDGELSEITSVKPAYGNLSYIQGFQNTKPRNFIHDYVEIADEAGASTLYVVNMRYASPQEVADQIKFLVDNGQTIAGVEMDNEVYAKGGFYYTSGGNKAATSLLGVTNYLNDADIYRAAISAVVPGLTYAVSAAPKDGYQEGGVDSDGEYNLGWNTALAANMGAHGYTNYIMHFYDRFYSCEQLIPGNDRDMITDCAQEELRVFDNNQAGELLTSLPYLLDYYATTFPGKHLWVTEWNINQDPERTDGKLANTIIHGVFTQLALNIFNDANVRHGGDFLTYASYHTFATDGGNAMVNKHVSKGAGNKEPDDIGDFVRRTPYYAYMSMKDIFKGGYTPMEASFTLDTDALDPEDITLHAYKKADGTVALAITNTTQKTLTLGTITIDGKTVSLDDTESEGYFMDGDSNYASRGDTEFAVNPGHEVTIRDDDYDALTDVYLPGFGLGTLTMTPTYETEVMGPVAPSPDGNESFSTVTKTYATTPAGTALKFDLNTPNGAAHPLPLVFFLHGGQFGPGGTNAADGYIQDFTGAGYAVAEVAYRAITEGGFPIQLEDIKGAIRYARAHAEELNIDPDRIAVLGTSSGGMIMSLVGTTGNVPTLEGTVGGNTSFSSRPNATIDLFGSIDPANPFNLAQSVADGFKNWRGCAPTDPCPQIQDAIAANYADSTDAPFLIIHGTSDQEVMYANSPVLDGLLDSAGIDSTFIAAPGVGHDKDTILTDYMTDIINFLDATLYADADDYVPPTDDCGFFAGIFGNCSDGGVVGDDEDWSLTINGIEKQPHFNSAYEGYPTPITMQIQNPTTGAVITEVSDLTNKETDLNDIAPAGLEYLLRFYDATGTLMEPVWPNVKVLDGDAPNPPTGGGETELSCDDNEVEHQDNDWSLTLNGKEKHNKYNGLYEGAPTPITMRIFDVATGATAYTINDVTNTNINLNDVLTANKTYNIEVTDCNEDVLVPAWEVDTSFFVQGATGGGAPPTGPLPDTTAPSIPTGVTMSDAGTDSVSFFWSASTDNTGVTAYDIYENGSFAGETSNLSIVIEGLDEGTSYTFTVRALDAVGNTSGDSSPISITTDVTPKECADGEDNDGDGKVDFPTDHGCTGATDDSEDSEGDEKECEDGIDNDGDGRIDYPQDHGCSKGNDNSEDSDEGTGGNGGGNGGGCSFLDQLFGGCNDPWDTPTNHGGNGGGNTPPPDTTAPSVSLTSPSNGTTITGPNLILSATASDNVAVQGVEFYITQLATGTTTLVATDTSSPYQYAWTTSGIPSGAYQIKAKATDTSGNEKTSSFVKVVK